MISEVSISGVQSFAPRHELASALAQAAAEAAAAGEATEIANLRRAIDPIS